MRSILILIRVRVHSLSNTRLSVRMRSTESVTQKSTQETPTSLLTPVRFFSAYILSSLETRLWHLSNLQHTDPWIRRLRTCLQLRRILSESCFILNRSDVSLKARDCSSVNVTVTSQSNIPLSSVFLPLQFQLRYR